jgi:MFS superfamily sulfate permease-like transporter
MTWPVFRGLAGASLPALGHDLTAGLTLAAIAIPEQMATARLGGFAPEIGLVAFIAATVAFAAFGANRQLSAGADSTITPIFAGSLALLAAAGTARYAELAAALALMVGAILVVAGLLKLGWIADLLSKPVTTGFLAGISLLILLSQAPAILGLPEESGNVYRRLAMLVGSLGQASWITLAIGLSVFAVTWAAERIDARIPGALIALAGATLVSTLFNLAGRGVAVLGEMSAPTPHLAVPILGLENVLPLVGLAMLVAMVVMVQTAATTRSFSAVGDPDVDRDYIGVGAGALLAGLLGAFPVNASPPRTAAVAETGGRTQFAGLAAAFGVLVLAAFGTRLLAQTPAAALAGVLLYIALRIFHVRDFAQILGQTRAEFALAALTTALIVLLPIETGVAVGMFLSLAHGVFTMTRAQVIGFERAPGTTVWWPATEKHPGETLPDVLVVGFQAPFCFLNAYALRRGLLDRIERGKGVARLMVLEASSVAEIDFTAAEVLSQVVERARAAGVDFAVARLESIRAYAGFKRFGLTDQIGKDHIFLTVDAAIQSLRREAPAG